MLKTKTRPLGQFSDFVVEDLPALLANDHAAIPSKVQEILANLIDDNRLAEAYSSNRELALMDLKFAEAAILFTSDSEQSSRVPEILSNSVDWFCAGIDIPALQYHELIEINPEADLRTFTQGEARETEILFYRSHWMIEQRLRRIIKACEEYLEEPNAQSSIFTSYQDLFDFGPVGTLMSKLHGMDNKHFKAFREYLMPPRPVRGFDGPSGAYSWRIPFLEFLIWGKSLPEIYKDKIKNNLKYYSQEGRDHFEKVIPSWDSAQGLCDYGDDLNANAVVHTCIRFMKPFRMEHYRAADTQLPKEMRDQAPGTSGEEKPGLFLRNRIRSMKELYEDYSADHPLQ